jgi:ketosteroid isomerase-like protein
MAETPEVMEGLARQVRVALDGGDLSRFSELLDPEVTWGAPAAPRPSCQNRNQVLRWYQKGQEAGVRAEVSEVSVHGDRILVTMTVGGSGAAEDRGGAALRWQVLRVRQGRVAEIVGFDHHDEARAWLATADR